MRYYLIGMPGSGKTTLGKEIAASIGLEFCDLDYLIEEMAGKSISEIFEQNGEEEFRDQESKVLKNISFKNCIISTGGGTPCFADNLEFMKKNGVVIFINAPVEVLRDRLIKEVDKRPLLKDKPDLRAFLAAMFVNRVDFYRQAHFTIENQAQLEKIINRKGLQ